MPLTESDQKRRGSGIMPALADSDAKREPDRTYSQHQAALTLLQGLLSNTSAAGIRWLDVACGRGQIIGSLASNFEKSEQSLIEYWGYDVKEDFIRETRKTASNLSFAFCKTKVGELADLDRIYDKNLRFDFITFINTVHEVEPVHLAGLLADLVLRLNEGGILFIYDMEQIKPQELGALPWQRKEVVGIVGSLYEGFGTQLPAAVVSHWTHSTCTAWNVQVHRGHFGIGFEQARRDRNDIVQKLNCDVAKLLDEKLKECQMKLEAYTLTGTKTEDAASDEKVRLLHDFWAVWRALEQFRPLQS